MKNLPASNFQILEPLEFLEDVKLEAHSAKKRIWAQAMDVEPGQLISQLLLTIEKKAKEGLDARLHADWYSLLVTSGDFNYFMRLNHNFYLKEKHRLVARHSFFKRLRQNNVKILFTNPPGVLEKLFPFRGRNHMKIVIVDDVAWIGGINFNEESMKYNDFMVKLTDSNIVHPVVELYKKIDTKEHFNDYKIDCNSETSLLVDSGKIGSSIILDNALSLVETARSTVFMTTAFFPDTKMVKALHAVHKKGGEVKVIAPTPRSMSGIYMYVEKLNYEIMRFRKLFFPTKMLNTKHHAKMLVVDRRTGMFGSHNFSGRGVTMGTGEVALRSTNQLLVENLLKFFDNTYQKD